MITTEALIKIAADARLAAAQTLTLKIPFRGSMPAAKRMGYPLYSYESKIFSAIYLHFLLAVQDENSLQVDALGYLTNPGKIRIGDRSAEMVYAVDVIFGTNPETQVEMDITVYAESPMEASILAERIGARVIAVTQAV